MCLYAERATREQQPESVGSALKRARVRNVVVFSRVSFVRSVVSTWFVVGCPGEWRMTRSIRQRARFMKLCHIIMAAEGFLWVFFGNLAMFPISPNYFRLFRYSSK